MTLQLQHGKMYKNGLGKVIEVHKTFLNSEVFIGGNGNTYNKDGKQISPLGGPDEALMEEHIVTNEPPKVFPIFTWGHTIDRFTYDFDGEVMEVVKYHPWIDGTRNVNTDVVDYHCPLLNESSGSLMYLVIAFFARINLGLNQRALVTGIYRSLTPDNSDI